MYSYIIKFKLNKDFVNEIKYLLSKFKSELIIHSSSFVIVIINVTSFLNKSVLKLNKISLS